MTKTELLNALKMKADLSSQAEAEAIINSLGEIILEDLASAPGNATRLFNFGTFKSVAVGARTARNPRTGEAIAVPAKTVIKFVTAKNYKNLDLLNLPE